MDVRITFVIPALKILLSSLKLPVCPMISFRVYFTVKKLLFPLKGFYVVMLVVNCGGTIKISLREHPGFFGSVYVVCCDHCVCCRVTAVDIIILGSLNNDDGEPRTTLREMWILILHSSFAII